MLRKFPANFISSHSSLVIRFIISVILCLFTMSVSAISYNYKMIEYKGGIISELNNCGPVYTDNGKYLMGQRNLTARLTTKNISIIEFGSVGNGVAAFLDNGDIYFSPDGRYLDGGGSTKKLANLPVVINTIRGGVISVDSSITGYGNYLITMVPSTYQVATGIRGTIKETWHKHDIKIYEPHRQSSPIKSFSINKKEKIRIIGVANNYIYVQLSDKTIGYFSSLGALENPSNLRVLHSSVGIEIDKLIPYRGGLLAYNRNSVYWSSNPSHVISGSGVKVLYSGARNISSLVNYGGLASEDGGSSRGIIVSFEDGYIYFSPNGNNLAGGGTSSTLVFPIDTNKIKSQLKKYLDGLASASFLTTTVSGTQYIYRDPVTNSAININNLSVRFLNRGESSDYAKNFILFNGTGNSRVTSVVSDLGGVPATVTVYDKGWDGIEYKWRSRGNRNGLFTHSVSESYFGAPEIRIKATNSCVVAASYEEIGGEGEPFTVGDWNLNADFTVSRNNAGLAALNNAFAAGGVQVHMPNPYESPFPSNYTLMEIYLWAKYNISAYITDKYGLPKPPGLPIYYLQTDADRT